MTSLTTVPSIREIAANLCNDGSKLLMEGNYMEAFLSYKKGTAVLEQSCFSSIINGDEEKSNNFVSSNINASSTTGWTVLMKMSPMTPLMIRMNPSPHQETIFNTKDEVMLSFKMNDDAEQQDNGLSAILLYNMGLLLMARQDYRNALTMFDLVRELFHNGDDSHYESNNALFKMFPVHFHALMAYHSGVAANKCFGVCPLASKHFSHALDYAATSNNSSSLVLLYGTISSGIGRLFLQSGLFAEAEAAYQLALYAFHRHALLRTTGTETAASDGSSTNEEREASSNAHRVHNRDVVSESSAAPAA